MTTTARVSPSVGWAVATTANACSSRAASTLAGSGPEGQLASGQGTSDGCGGSGRSDAAATAFSTSAKTSTADDANDAIALRASDNMAP
jgi:hypothetical protein